MHISQKNETFKTCQKSLNEHNSKLKYSRNFDSEYDLEEDNKILWGFTHFGNKFPIFKDK